MSIKRNKGFLIVSVFIIFSDVIFIFLNYTSSLKTLNKDIEDWAQQTKNIFKIALDSKATSMQQLATFIANDPKITTIFNEGKIVALSEGGGTGKEKTSIIRKKLFKLVNPSWENMIALYDVRQLHFHLGPGSTSFLRVHRPDKFGDNMDDVRYTIVDANVKLKPTKGFETGRVYSGIRGVAPVFVNAGLPNKKAHVGALETGTSFTVLLNNLQGNLKSEFAVLLTKNHVKQNMWADFVKNHFTPELRIDDFFIESTTNNDIKNVLSVPRVSPLLKVPGSVFIKGDTPLQVCTFPLRDYRGTLDKALPKSGLVVVWKDASKKWATFVKTLSYNIIYAIFALLLVECILFLTWKYSRKKLVSIIEEKTLELSKSKLRLKALIENLPTGIFVVDPLSDKIISMNPKASNMIGALSENVVGQKFNKLLIEIDSSVYIETDDPIKQKSLNYKLKPFTGNEIPVLKTEINAKINDQNVLIICLSDLTKQKEAENEHLQREKLQSILEMAGAICHEFNQPLMIISGYSELLLNDIPEDTDQYNHIKQLNDQINRLGTITKKLMNITEYKTKRYLNGKIIDIHAASDDKK